MLSSCSVVIFKSQLVGTWKSTVSVPPFLYLCLFACIMADKRHISENCVSLENILYFPGIHLN